MLHPLCLRAICVRLLSRVYHNNGMLLYYTSRTCPLGSNCRLSKSRAYPSGTCVLRCSRMMLERSEPRFDAWLSG